MRCGWLAQAYRHAAAFRPAQARDVGRRPAHPAALQQGRCQPAGGRRIRRVSDRIAPTNCFTVANPDCKRQTTAVSPTQRRHSLCQPVPALERSTTQGSTLAPRAVARLASRGSPHHVHDRRNAPSPTPRSTAASRRWAALRESRVRRSPCQRAFFASGAAYDAGVSNPPDVTAGRLRAAPAAPLLPARRAGIELFANCPAVTKSS